MAFLKWSARRLYHLTMSGIGLVSTLTAVALFALPSVTDGVSRWLALAPILAYVILALLKDEYDRVAAACLTMRVIWEVRGEGKSDIARWLEIRNCGPVRIDNVQWEFDEPRGWNVVTDLPFPTWNRTKVSASI